IRHFRLARQLTQHLLEHDLHFLQLCLERFEVDRLRLLALEVAPEIQLLAFQSLEFGTLVGHEDVPAACHDHRNDDQREDQFDACWPAPGVRKIGIADVETAHRAPPATSSSMPSSSVLPPGLVSVT